MKRFYEWMKSQYDLDELKEIAEHGCANCAPNGMIYYDETERLYRMHSEELHNQLGEWIDEIGENPEFITDNLGSYGSFSNAMVWFVAEQYANEIIQTLQCEAE